LLITGFYCAKRSVAQLCHGKLKKTCWDCEEFWKNETEGETV